MKLIPYIFLSGLCSLPLHAFKLGIEALPPTLEKYRTLRIGLVTNQSGCLQDKKRTIDLLREKNYNLVALFAPEHGLDGTIMAEKSVHDSIDAQSGLPVISLYQGGDRTFPITKERLDTIDVIFFDIQDSGMRHYTYISTLYHLLEQDKPIVVFDRPNPLGDIMEGPLVDSTHHSFISIAPIPLRHAMTIGELALFFNSLVEKPSPDLTIVRMKEFRRSEQLKQLITPLSPRIPRLASCFGYSFLGLFEEIAEAFKAGDTQKPFQYLMLDAASGVTPQHWNQVQKILHAYHVSSTPTTRNEHGITYTGLHIEIPTIAKVSSFNALVDLLSYLHAHNVHLTFKPAFETAMGTDGVCRFMHGDCDRATLALTINEDLKKFYEKAKPYFLYKPWPRIITLYEKDYSSRQSAT